MFSWKNGTVSVQKATRRERALRERERVHLCCRKVTPPKQNKCRFLLLPTRHGSVVWKSGQTSLQIEKKKEINDTRLPHSKKMLNQQTR